MATSLRNKSTSKLDATMDRSDNLKQLTLPQAMTSNMDANAANTGNLEIRFLTELEKLRQENKEGHAQTKQSLTNLETTMQELKSDINSLERRTAEVEGRISSTEDAAQRHERAIRYLLQREIDLSTKYEDLQNRQRRNNLRIYGVPQDSEGKDVIAFVKDLLETTMELASEANMQIKQAHRALTPKNNSVPRSIIAKFVDYSVKDSKLLRQAWRQKQKRRSHVREAFKQLKQKNIRSKMRLPRTVLTEEGDKTYSRCYERLESRFVSMKGRKWNLC
ncbi:hypothetical protein WMY93_027653 [Mugilogobius chulae]|uniref:L1 transposable element RRM domain-containing protein n=1 Tax=Mugilogobius chulae TaxID=88201 RepID=A0AAW0N4J9_9GOBI